MTSQVPFGLFQYVPSISQGDPYQNLEKVKRDPKSRGKQFQTNATKHGKTPEVYFNQGVVQSVYVGSKYTTLAEQDRKYQLAKKTKQIVPAPFKPSTPSNEMEGLGSYYGAFNKWENMKASNNYDKRQASKDGVQFSPRNFLTSPPKKGHVGLLGCRQGAQGVVNEYKYEPNPEPVRPVKDRVVPFKPSSPAKKGLFSQDCHVTFTGLTYSNEGPRERRKKGEELKPWSPANVKITRGAAGRIYGTVNPFPEYKEQGPSHKFRSRTADDSKRIGPVFKPSTVPKSVRSPSIANLPRNSLQPL